MADQPDRDPLARVIACIVEAKAMVVRNRARVQESRQMIQRATITVAKSTKVARERREVVVRTPAGTQLITWLQDDR